MDAAFSTQMIFFMVPILSGIRMSIIRADYIISQISYKTTYSFSVDNSCIDNADLVS